MAGKQQENAGKETRAQGFINGKLSATASAIQKQNPR